MKTPLSRSFVVVTVSAASLAVAGCGGPSEPAATPAPAAPAAEQAQPAQAEPAPAAAEETAAQAAPAGADRGAAIDAARSALAGLTGDADKGKRVFVKCMACHGIDEGQNKIGPSLYGVVGASAGHVGTFKYSPAMAQSGLVWTEEALFAYLANPAAFVPGNRMIFPGLPSEQDRADVIAYLESVTE